MRHPHRFAQLAAAEISHDRRHFAVRIETQGGPALDLEMPIDRVGDLVQALVTIAAHVNPGAPTDHREYSPIPIQGLGFAAGRTPDTTLLVVGLPGFALAFEMTSTQVAALGSAFAQVARALAAGGTKQ